MHPLQGARVQSVVRELRSKIPRGMAKKGGKKQKPESGQPQAWGGLWVI